MSFLLTCKVLSDINGCDFFVLSCYFGVKKILELQEFEGNEGSFFGAGIRICDGIFSVVEGLLSSSKIGFFN